MNKTKKLIRVVLVGDSTVTDEAGWGGGIGGFFKKHVQIINCARGGRSSKSFINEGRLKKALAKKPDYLFIQFGHNDVPGKGDYRETDPDSTYMDYLKIYIRDARKTGAKPVLVTSVERRQFDDKGKIVPSLALYANAVKRVGRAEKVPVINLHSKSIRLFQKLGELGGQNLQPKGDRTHFNAKGGKALAKIIALELPEVFPELAEFLKK
jgi:pectinesterase